MYVLRTLHNIIRTSSMMPTVSSIGTRIFVHLCILKIVNFYNTMIIRIVGMVALLILQGLSPSLSKSHWKVSKSPRPVNSTVAVLPLTRTPSLIK